MTLQMIVRIDEEMKEKFQKSAQREGKTVSQALRDLMQTYVQDHDAAAYIDSLWDKIGKKFKSRGIGLKEVNKAIRQSRSAKT
jgi:predicted DNA-binding protein